MQQYCNKSKTYNTILQSQLIDLKWINLLISAQCLSLMLCVLPPQYYNKRKTYFAHDALRQCTMGDIVLLKALTEARSKHVKHELAEIVYKVGRVVDPLTGKKVAGTEFVEPLTDLPLSLDEDATLTEKLQELNISAASSAADAPPAQTPAS